MGNNLMTYERKIELRFTEEIFEDVFDTRLSVEIKDCKSVDKYIENYTKCWECYQLGYLKKVDKLSRAFVEKFIVYQANLRKNGKQFLREYLELIVDAQDYLDYDAIQNFETILQKLIDRKNLTTIENIDLIILEELLDIRPESSTIEFILQKLCLVEFLPSKELIISKLLQKGYIKTLYQGDMNVPIEITLKGIEYFQKYGKNSFNESYSTYDFNNGYNELVEEIAKLKVEVLKGQLELSEMVEKVLENTKNQQFREYFSNKTISDIAKKQVCLWILEYGFNKGVLDPAFDSFQKLIL